MNEKIHFTIPYVCQKSYENIKNMYKGINYTKECEDVVKEKYGFEDTIFTTSCTHALEMMAMILDIKQGDEVIIPSYTFVSTANAFVKFGAKVIFADSEPDNPNISFESMKELVTDKTKAIVVVHYGGWSPRMELFQEFCKSRNIYLLEDGAQAINSYYKGRPLGSFGILSAFSFHYTKNIQCSEGGMLVINDKKLVNKAHIVCNKGTNRHDFVNGVVDKYEWVDVGSSYPLGELNAAYLLPQLEDIDMITKSRKNIWDIYTKELKFLEKNDCFVVSKPLKNCEGNYHNFYLLFKNESDLKKLQKTLKDKGIYCSTHYKCLHRSKYCVNNNFTIKNLKNADFFEENLLRLPLYTYMKENLAYMACNAINEYYNFHIIDITNKEISKKYLDNIVELKSTFWTFNKESQLDWIKNNLKHNDRHILCLYKGELVSYASIMIRNVSIIDSVITTRELRGNGFGRKILEYITQNIGHGFLLCEKNNIKFYENFGWKINNNIEVSGKEVNKNLYKMTYNFIDKRVSY